MNAPPFPLNPQTGDWFQNWVWNGARWVASPTTGLRVLTRVFGASGPYMPSPGLVSLTVECVGGGGGGAGVFLPDATYAGSGGGGGSGGYSRKTLPAALVRGGVLVTIGEGGPISAVVGDAPDGQATSFGAFCLANGGGGGVSSTTTTWGGGGNGAPAGIGDIAFPGNAGGSGYLLVGMTPGSIGLEGGAGASSAFGGGPNGGGNFGEAAPGVSSVGNGAGGSGAWQNWVAVTEALPGGAGEAGICIVTEYCWGDRDQPDIGWRPPLDVNVSFPKPPWPGGQPGPMPPWSWWPWWPPGPGRPGPGPGPWPGVPGPRSHEAVEFEAGQPYDQSINPQTGQPWEDEP